MNLFIKVHLRPFSKTRYSAQDDFDNALQVAVPLPPGDDEAHDEATA